KPASRVDSQPELAVQCDTRLNTAKSARSTPPRLPSSFGCVFARLGHSDGLHKSNTPGGTWFSNMCFTSFSRSRLSLPCAASEPGALRTPAVTCQLQNGDSRTLYYLSLRGGTVSSDRLPADKTDRECAANHERPGERNVTAIDRRAELRIRAGP